MILGDNAIYKAFTNQWQARKNGKCMSKDQLFDAIGPNSFDVTLGFAIMHQGLLEPFKPESTVIDPYENTDYYMVDYIKDTGFKLEPGQFILGVTQERFDTDKALGIDVGFNIGDSAVHNQTHFVQKYDGRSTMGRLGIASHVTAGFGDYGFKDYWTLELVNLGNVPVILYAGMRIGQISFEAVYEPSKYEGAYTDVSDPPTPKPPKLGRDRF